MSEKNPHIAGALKGIDRRRAASPDDREASALYISECLALALSDVLEAQERMRAALRRRGIF